MLLEEASRVRVRVCVEMGHSSLLGRCSGITIKSEGVLYPITPLLAPLGRRSEETPAVPTYILRAGGRGNKSRNNFGGTFCQLPVFQRATHLPLQ